MINRCLLKTRQDKTRQDPTIPNEREATRQNKRRNQRHNASHHGRRNPTPAPEIFGLGRWRWRKRKTDALCSSERIGRNSLNRQGAAYVSVRFLRHDEGRNTNADNRSRILRFGVVLVVVLLVITCNEAAATAIAIGAAQSNLLVDTGFCRRFEAPRDGSRGIQLRLSKPRTTTETITRPLLQLLGPPQRRQGQRHPHAAFSRCLGDRKNCLGVFRRFSHKGLSISVVEGIRGSPAADLGRHLAAG
mmetsp:Transcript_24596/g.51990  ORF Transcript_24596/g.51990 Transcript_24596/m.51990 type:complete len:246 (+) Transcript_24596:104-841(+)